MKSKQIEMVKKPQRKRLSCKKFHTDTELCRKNGQNTFTFNVLSVDIKTWDKRHNCIKSKIRNIHWVNLAFYKQGYKNYDILSETPS
jgi:hypothetical protein